MTPESSSWWGKRKCYVVVTRPDGFSLGIAVENEPGYYKTDYLTVEHEEAAEEWCNRCNATMGITPSMAMEIKTSTIRAQNIGMGGDLIG